MADNKTQVVIDARVTGLSQITGLRKGLQGVEKQSNQTAIGLNSLKSAAAGLLAGFGLLEAAKFTIFKTAELETQTKSLEVLTGGLNSAKDIISELQAFGAVTPFTSSELIETAKRLKAFGVETEKLVQTTQRLGDLAGATGAELDGIATAYGQIQAKGKLQTEELLQLQERGIDIASTLKEQYKLTGEEFTKALEAGKISAEAVEFALQELTETGGKYAGGAIAQSDTLAGKFSTLEDGIGRLATAIGTELKPAMKFVLDLAIQSINQFLPPLLKLLTQGIQLFLAMPEPIQAVIIGITGIGATAALLLPLISAIGTIKVTLLAGATAAGVLKVALLGLPFAAVAAVAGVFIGSIISARQEQENFNRVLETGTKEMLENALATEERNLAEARSRRIIEGGRSGEGMLKGQARDIEQAERRIDQLKAKLLGVGVVGQLTPEIKLPEIKLPELKIGDTVGGDSAAATKKPRDDTARLKSMNQSYERQLDLMTMETELEKELARIEHDRIDALQRLSELQNVDPGKLEEAQANANLLAQNLEINAIEESNKQIQGEILDRALARVGAALDIIRPLEDQRELLEAKLNGTERQVRLEQEIERLTKGLPPLVAAYVEELIRGNDELANFNDELTTGEELLKGSYDIMSNQIMSSIDGLISGTQSWNDVLSDTLGMLGQMFMRVGFSSLGEQLFPDIFEGGGYTGNGPRAGGIDGKGGFPAILHPQETVIDHTRTQQQLTAQSSAREANLTSTDEPAGIGATRQQLARQREVMRSNELAATTAPSASTLNVKFESQSINGVEYVTAEQHRKGMTQAAQQGRALTLQALQNSVKSRRQVGLA